MIIDLLTRQIAWSLQGDSGNYEVLSEGIKRVAGIEGMSCEIGVRRGGGTFHIMESLKATGQQRLHIAIDPYGNIDYPVSSKYNDVCNKAREEEGASLPSHLVFTEADRGNNTTIKCDYTNTMRNECLVDLYYYCLANDMPFLFFNLEDTEFFKRYSDGVPFYNDTVGKQLISDYAFVHFDGPHIVEAVKAEVDFFHPRSVTGAVWVFDDVGWYDQAQIHEYIEPLGWKLYETTVKKMAYCKQ